MAITLTFVCNDVLAIFDRADGRKPANLHAQVVSDGFGLNSYTSFQIVPLYKHPSNMFWIFDWLVRNVVYNLHCTNQIQFSQKASPTTVLFAYDTIHFVHAAFTTQEADAEDTITFVDRVNVGRGLAQSLAYTQIVTFTKTNNQRLTHVLNLKQSVSVWKPNPDFAVGVEHYCGL